jgi:D-glycero-D-manno-heptose 1,7-bisphosphate phosphatase
VGINEVTGGPRAVFFDRDGVINRAIIHDGKPYPPASLADAEILPGAITSARRLAAAGYIVIGITNQPDVARGTQSREEVESINGWIMHQLPLREILVCYHDDADQCDCRKPKPGLIFRAATKYGLDLARSWMVGDRWKDIAAGHAAGLRTIFVDYHYTEAFECPPASSVVQDVSQVADIVLKGIRVDA